MKTPIQKLSSSKLFYNQWPFKVECTIFGAYLIGRYKLSSVKEWCNGVATLGIGNSYGAKNINKGDLLVFVNAAEKYISNKTVKIRTEGCKFNLFCKDKAVLEDIDKTLNRWIRKISGPTSEEELEYLLSNGYKKRLCDNFPKGKYKYKLFLKNKFPEDRRKQFLEWAEKYKDQIEIKGTTKRWLANERMWAQDPFMYVQDDKMLGIVGLYISGYVKKVEEFTLRNSVLTA